MKIAMGITVFMKKNVTLFLLLEMLPFFNAKAQIPAIKGQLIYHQYSDYNAWDSELYLLDFSNNALTQISQNWNIDHEMNAHFSPDGSTIVFMGDIANDGIRDWDIFIWTIGQAYPANLTSGKGLREEDPKFSPDGTKIVFKEGHWDGGLGTMVYDLKEMNLQGIIINTVTNNTEEESMPYYTSDGKSIIYARGAGAGSDIYSVDTNGTNNKPLLTLTNLQEYYPITRDQNSFFYTQWVSATNHNDQVFIKYAANTNGVSLPFNDINSNYSDACPAGSQYAILSSTRPGGKGGYDLYIADLNMGSTWSLNNYNAAINTSIDQLGADYYPGNITGNIPGEGSKTEMQVFPNPVLQGRNIVIISPYQDDTEFTLYDLYGKEILEITFKGKEEIPTKNLNPGIYLYRLGRSISFKTGYIEIIK